MANVKVPPFTEAPSTVVGGTPQTVFPFDFPFWAAADLLVYVDGVLLDAADYSVEGFAVQDEIAVEGGYGSGEVTLDTAVSSVTVTIDRMVVGDRQTQFSRSAPLPPTALNGDLNRLTARQQDLERQKLTTPTFERAGKYLGFDADSNPVALSGTGADAALRTDLAAEGGASLVATQQDGSGAVQRSAQSKLRDWRDARDFDGETDGTTQQAAVQALLDSIPERGALPVWVPPGVKFDPQSLTWPRRSHMVYFQEDATTTPGYFAGGSGELVWWMQNSSYRAGTVDNPTGADGLGNDSTGGEVNEVRFTSSFHPGVAVDVQKSVGDRTGYLQPGQEMLEPARASFNIMDDGNGVWRTVWQDGLTYTPFNGLSQHGWYRRVRLTGIGTAQWASVPARGTLVTGVTSGARGHVVAVTADHTDLELFDGRFAPSEAVTDNNETTAFPATISYTILQCAPFSVDTATGAHSIGDRPPRIGSEMLNVAGRLRLVPTRQASLVQPKQVAKPGLLIGESEEAGSPHAVGLEYDPSEKTDATRRLRVVRQSAPTEDPEWAGELVPMSAMAIFGHAGTVAPNSTNVAAITNAGTGLYNVVYTQLVGSSGYGVATCGVESFYMPGWTAGVTFFAEGGCQVRVFNPSGALSDIPVGGLVSFKMEGADV